MMRYLRKWRSTVDTESTDLTSSITSDVTTYEEAVAAPIPASIELRRNSDDSSSQQEVNITSSDHTEATLASSSVSVFSVISDKAVADLSQFCPEGMRRNASISSEAEMSEMTSNFDLLYSQVSRVEAAKHVHILLDMLDEQKNAARQLNEDPLQHGDRLVPKYCNEDSVISRASSTDAHHPLPISMRSHSKKAHSSRAHINYRKNTTRQRNPQQDAHYLSRPPLSPLLENAEEESAQSAQQVVNYNEWKVQEGSSCNRSSDEGRLAISLDCSSVSERFVEERIGSETTMVSRVYVC